MEKALSSAKAARHERRALQRRASTSGAGSPATSDTIPPLGENLAAQHELFFSAPIDFNLVCDKEGGSSRRSSGGGAIAALHGMYNRRFLSSAVSKSTRKGRGEGRFDEARLERLREGLVRIFELQHQREREQRQVRYEGLKELLTLSLFKRQKAGSEGRSVKLPNISKGVP